MKTIDKAIVRNVRCDIFDNTSGAVRSAAYSERAAASALILLTFFTAHTSHWQRGGTYNFSTYLYT